MTEDNATQGWRKNLNPLIGLYDLELDGRHIAMGLFESDADLVLAALQRPSREAELRAEIESLERSEGRESDRASFMVEAAERNLARAVAAEVREAALVEALRECYWEAEGQNSGYSSVPPMAAFRRIAKRAKALISPPGLSA